MNDARRKPAPTPGATRGTQAPKPETPGAAKRDPAAKPRSPGHVPEASAPAPTPRTVERTKSLATEPPAPTAERILAVAARRFARSGYAAVGVREIAAEAGVNISMISYYFGGKIGLLTEIITRFFDTYQAIVEANLVSEAPFEQRLHSLVRDIVHSLSADRDVWKVGFLELPHDLPEIARVKADRVRRLREIFASAPGFHGAIPPGVEERLPILGPAFASLVFSTFLLEPVIDDAFATTHDHAFTERYIETIATLFTRGIAGFLPQPGARVSK